MKEQMALGFGPNNPYGLCRSYSDVKEDCRLDRRAENSGAILMQVRFPAAASGCFSLSQSQLSVQTL